MRCEEFEFRLNEILDRRRNPRSDAELWLHATSCPECGDLLAGYQALFAGFKRREVVAPPETMAARVRLQLGHNRGRGVWRERAPLALIAAALVLAAILPGLWNAGGSTPAASQDRSKLATTVLTTAGELTMTGLEDPAPGDPTSSGAPLSVLVRMAGDQMRFLAVHSEQSATLAWRLVPSVEEVIEGIASAPRASTDPGSKKGGRPHHPSAAGSPPTPLGSS